MLQLKVTHGKGWSDKDYSEAVKQGIRTPGDVNDLIYQVENILGLTAFFFDPKCILAKALTKFRATLKSYIVAFEACQARDTSFATRVSYAIDTRIFRWLQMCRDCPEREQVSDNLIDFDDIARDVLLDRYSQPLPSSIKLVEKPNGSDKKRKREDDESGAVENKGTIQEWLLKPDENYTEVFAGKHVELKPKIDGRLICSRFHTKGYCFDNCKNKATHVDSSKLPKKIQEHYGKYIRTCRKQE